MGIDYRKIRNTPDKRQTQMQHEEGIRGKREEEEERRERGKNEGKKRERGCMRG